MGQVWKTSDAAVEFAAELVPPLQPGEVTFQHSGQLARANRQRRTQRNLLAGYFTFCETHDLPLWPVTEQNVLRYLHLHPRKPATMQQIVESLNRTHRMHELEPACGARTNTYLRGLQRQADSSDDPGNGESEPGEPVEPAPPQTPILTEDTERLIATSPKVTDAAATFQAVLRIYRTSGLALADIIHADRNSARIHDSQTAEFTARNGTRTIITNPNTVTGLRYLLNNPPPDTHTLTGPMWGFINRLRERLPLLGVTGDPYTVGNLLATLTPDQQDAVEEGVAGAAVYGWLRTTLLILLGHTNAFRYSDVEYINLDKVHRTDHGYTLHIPFAKTDADGDGRNVHITHPFPEKPCGPYAPCDPLCPVAHLTRYLLVRPIAGRKPAANSRWLFPGNGDTPLTLDGAYKTITEFWDDHGGQPDDRIGTRSLRIGSLTSGYLHNVTLPELADRADHRNLTITRGYIQTDPQPHTIDPHD